MVSAESHVSLPDVAPLSKKPSVVDFHTYPHPCLSQQGKLFSLHQTRLNCRNGVVANLEYLLCLKNLEPWLPGPGLLLSWYRGVQGSWSKCHVQVSSSQGSPSLCRALRRQWRSPRSRLFATEPSHRAQNSTDENQTRRVPNWEGVFASLKKYIT